MKLKNKLRILFLILAGILGLSDPAQSQIRDTSMNELFATQVKSVDEFMARFNGEENRPGIPQDSLARMKNIVALFDMSMAPQGEDGSTFRQSLLEFVSNVCRWQGRLSLANTHNFAEVQCVVKVNKKVVRVTLVMQMECSEEGSCRWSITGVHGLKAAGFYSDKMATISPVEHEIHFMGLMDFVSQNRKLVPSLRGRQQTIDEFSMLAGMLCSGAAQLEAINDVRFHFLDVPNYVFVIEEKGREGNNSGWLITRLYVLTDIEKEDYLSNILGK